ncbi:MAG: hypothetical protein EB053_06880, partial [Chlamydiae bacterium]|nr:hypothetical protein [Chlamydiota bacterium]
MIHSVKRFLIHPLLMLHVCIAAWSGSIMKASALEATVDADPPVEAMISRLSGLGFFCLKATQDPNSARRCVGRIHGYSKKVAIYLPVHYEPALNHQPVITHFQGWTVHGSFEETLKFYQLGQ